MPNTPTWFQNNFPHRANTFPRNECFVLLDFVSREMWPSCLLASLHLRTFPSQQAGAVEKKAVVQAEEEKANLQKANASEIKADCEKDLAAAELGDLKGHIGVADRGFGGLDILDLVLVVDLDFDFALDLALDVNLALDRSVSIWSRYRSRNG